MIKPVTFFQGFIIGAGMSIPGLSGGTLAIVLGIYDKLIYYTANILSDIKNKAVFFIFLGTGGVLGFFSAAKIITMLLSTAAEVPLRYAFFGAACAAIIPVLKRSDALPFDLSKLMLIVCGIIAAAAISMIPPITPGESGASGLLLQIAGGLIIAVALILPGISGSQMLMTLGLYDEVMHRVSELDILKLLPLAIGCIIGILLSAKLLANLIENTSSTYLVIIGFMFFSMKDLIPRSDSLSELLIGLLCACIGCAITSICISKETNKAKSTIL